MIRIKLSAKLLVLLVMLSGCAGGELVGKLPVIENYFATVHIARPAGIIGCGVRTTIQLDYKDFYELACGDSITFMVPSEKPITISQTTSHIEDDIQIEPQAGKQYYFENDSNGWAFWLHEASESRFNEIAKRCSSFVKL